ncbi:ABC transporter permease [Anaerotignum sp. MB30-C6]|uniref:ABC transporter permease n=1 Tax=Anaerotignum sp. MB30-C6 TaxID=3070814 RepID=UPI0027DD22EA|nr:ABC transporter permease [Anaerotignum sp. MB30-C6]WMI82213.1 ABC transporter permease [Anaerotignum sp. MB30-C6]
MRAAFRLFFREWCYLLKRPRTLILMICIPIFITLICGTSYEKGYFSDLKMGVVDYSYSAQTREVVEAFQQSPYFEIMGYYENEDQLETAMKNGEIVGCLIFPSDFTKDLQNGRQAQVLLGSNGVNMSYGSTINVKGSEVLGTVSAQMAVKSLVAKGSTVEDALAKMNPVGFYTRQWYNPTNNFGYFLSFGFIIATVQQVLIYFAAISLVREKESDRLGELKGVHPIFQVIIKCLVYFIIAMGTWAACTWIMVNKFGIPMRGSAEVWVAYSSLFILSIITLGQLFSAILPNPVIATSFSLVFTSPSLVLSGYTWPTMALTSFYQRLAKVFPLTYFALGYRDMALMGSGFEAIQQEMITLGCISGSCLVLSCIIWTIRLKRIEKKDQALQISLRDETAQAVSRT